MISGRDDTAEKEIAVHIQQYLAKELNIDEKFASVSIEEIEKENPTAHMEYLKDKKMFAAPGVEGEKDDEVHKIRKFRPQDIPDLYGMYGIRRSRKRSA